MERVATDSSSGDDDSDSSISLSPPPLSAIDPMHVGSALSTATPQTICLDVAPSLPSSAEVGNATDLSHAPRARAPFSQATGAEHTDGSRLALDEWEGAWDPTAPSDVQRQSFDRETVLLTHDYFGVKVWSEMNRVDQQRALAKCAVDSESFLNHERQNQVAAASRAHAVSQVHELLQVPSVERENSAQKKRGNVLEFASRMEGSSGDGAAETANPAHRAARTELQRAQLSQKQGPRIFVPTPPPTRNARADDALAGDANWPFRSGMGPVFYALLLACAMVPSWIGWLGEWTNLGEWKNEKSAFKASVGDVANRFGMLGSLSVLSAFLCAPTERASTGLIGSTVVFWGWTVSYPLMAFLFTLARQEWFAASAFAFQLFFTHPILYLALSGLAHRIGTPLKNKVATLAEQRRVMAAEAAHAARPALETGPLWRAMHAGGGAGGPGNSASTSDSGSAKGQPEGTTVVVRS
jgi:hypothetical protein